jgi:cytoskeleton protein RodZ
MATFRQLHRTPTSLLGRRASRPAPTGWEETDVPRADCPRCGSVLVAAALSGAPSDCVLELRGGDVSLEAARDAFDDWLCRSCGHRWPHVQPAVEVLSGAASTDDRTEGVADPVVSPPDASTFFRDVVKLPDLPEGPETTDKTSPAVCTALRRAREERGLTLSEAATTTRVWERYLQALESDAPVEEFPAPAYATFFLREYAEFLGLNPVAIVREFEERHPVHEDAPVELQPDRGRRRRFVAIALAVASAVSLLALVLLPLAAGRKAEPASPTFAAVPGGFTGHAPATRHPSTPPPGGVRAVLRLSQPCWVQAIADGRVLERSTLQPGEPVVFRARHLLQLVFGNAGAVDLQVNGEPVATGTLGQVVRFELRWRHGGLLMRAGR